LWAAGDGREGAEIWTETIATLCAIDWFFYSGAIYIDLVVTEIMIAIELLTLG
jgi:hypothetical protein